MFTSRRKPSFGFLPFLRWPGTGPTLAGEHSHLVGLDWAVHVYAARAVAEDFFNAANSSPNTQGVKVSREPGSARSFCGFEGCDLGGRLSGSSYVATGVSRTNITRNYHL